MEKISTAIIMSCATLAIATLLCVVILSNAYKSVNTTNCIEVTGQAKAPITSDSGIWTLSLNYNANTREEAFAGVESSRKRVIEYLQNTTGGKDGKDKLESNEIVINQLSVDAIEELDSQYNNTGVILYYNASQEIKITSNKLYLLDELSRNIASDLGSTVEIQSNSVSYYCSDIASKKLEMVTAATEDAVNRAKNIVSKTNSKLGNIKSAKTGVFQITSVGSNMVDDYGINDLSSIDKEITCTIKVTFMIK